MASIIKQIFCIFFLFTTLALSSQPKAQPPPSTVNPRTTWTSLILTHNGEHLPHLTHPYTSLTPLGATQVHSAGSLIRRRYLTGPPSNTTGFVPLHGFHKNYIDNQRVSVLAAPEQPVVASAWAFLQGLYPPVEVPGGIGGSLLAGGGGVEAPLGGYQYGRVETAGGADWNSVWIAGSERCPNHVALKNVQVNSTAFKNTTLSNAPFYASTIPQVFKGVVGDPMVKYHNADLLYEYAAYAKVHNTTVASSLPAASLARLRALASKRIFNINGVNRGGAGEEEKDNQLQELIKPIAGRTLAEKVFYSLNAVTTSSRPGLLNLLFTSSAPFVGFAAISGLAESDKRFRGVPEAGSMMAFEVFSYTPAEDGVPKKEDLWVRFLYRNGTAEGAKLVGYPLFGRGKSKMDMRFSEFETEMGAIGLGVGEWCEACAAQSLFCPAFRASLDKGRKDEKAKSDAKKGGKKKGSSKLELGLGLGAAGLVVMLGILVIIGCARSQRKVDRGAGAGSDKEGGLEEGGGSWEMGVRNRKGEEERVKSHADYAVRDEEEVNPIGEPVRAEERV